MRSPREIAYRLRQELHNARLACFPPSLPHIPTPAPLPGLPSGHAVAAALQNSPHAHHLLELGDQILAGHFPLLGTSISSPRPLRWRRDPLRNIESPLRYFRFTPYLDVSQVGDQKIVWELNRHHHLTVLAQCWLLSSRPEFLTAIQDDLSSWWLQNPFQQGINWTAALEVAFRAFSWIWLCHWLGPAFPPPFYHRLLTSLFQHACHLEFNLSLYSSPNTHLLGEAVALHALATLFPWFPNAPRCRRLATSIIQSHIQTHVLDDGFYFEQSSFYHVYALDFFLFHAILEPTPPEYREKLARMARILTALQGPSRLLPFLGDDDGGRLFFPYGPRSHFARASVAATALLLNRSDLGDSPEDRHQLAAWWLGPHVLQHPPSPPSSCHSTHFPNSGLVTFAHHGLHAIIDAGPFGAGTAGHSHSDTLSLLLRLHDREILSDAGTFTYLADPQARNWHRGSSAHNTLRIDSRDQASPVNLFRWSNPPNVQIHHLLLDHPALSFLHASLQYHSFHHHRRVALLHSLQLVIVLDSVDYLSPPPAPSHHLLEQFWHWGPAGHPSMLLSAHPELTQSESSSPDAWHSPAFAIRHPQPLSRTSLRGPLPNSLAAVIDPAARPATLRLLPHPGGWQILYSGACHWTLTLPTAGDPLLTINP